MDRPKPKVGDRLVVKVWLDRKRPCEPRDVTVMKVGRKYFYVAQQSNGGERTWMRFHVSDWSSANDIWRYELYASMDEYREAMMLSRMRDDVERFFRQFGNVNKLRPIDLAEIHAILSRDGFVEKIDDTTNE